MRKFAYIDVDDTLIRSVGTKRIPITRTIEKVRSLKLEGWVLYCWSSVGADYAEEVARELGIQECFTDYLPKPTLIIDDIEPLGWPGISIIHPNEIQIADSRGAVATPASVREPSEVAMVGCPALWDSAPEVKRSIS